MNIYESDIESAHRTCDGEFVRAAVCDSLSLKGKAFLVNETGTIIYDVKCPESTGNRKKHDCTRTEDVHRTELVAYDIPHIILDVHSNVCVFFLCLVNHKNIITALQIVLCPIIFSYNSTSNRVSIQWNAFCSYHGGGRLGSLIAVFADSTCAVSSQECPVSGLSQSFSACVCPSDEWHVINSHQEQQAATCSECHLGWLIYISRGTTTSSWIR